MFPWPPVPGSLQAEANVLQHHLGLSAKFREARQLCNELKAERTTALGGKNWVLFLEIWWDLRGFICIYDDLWFHSL